MKLAGKYGSKICKLNTSEIHQFDFAAYMRLFWDVIILFLPWKTLPTDINMKNNMGVLSKKGLLESVLKRQ